MNCKMLLLKHYTSLGLRLRGELRNHQPLNLFALRRSPNGLEPVIGKQFGGAIGGTLSHRARMES